MGVKRDRAIPAASMKTDPFRCPGCDSQDLTLIGYLTRGFSERMQGGQVVERKLDDSLERDTSAIECHTCEVRWLIMTEEEYKLQEQCFNLQQTLMMYSPSFVKQSSSLPN